MHWVLIIVFMNGGSSAQSVGPYVDQSECEAAWEEIKKQNEMYTKRIDFAYLQGHVCAPVNHWNQS